MFRTTSEVEHRLFPSSGAAAPNQEQSNHIIADELLQLFDEACSQRHEQTRAAMVADKLEQGQAFLACTAHEGQTDREQLGQRIAVLEASVAELRKSFSQATVAIRTVRQEHATTVAMVTNTNAGIARVATVVDEHSTLLRACVNAFWMLWSYLGELRVFLTDKIHN